MLDAGLLHAPRRNVGLLLPDPGRATLPPPRRRGMDGEAAPAGADLEDVVARAELELLAHHLELGERGLLERGVAVLEDAARVHQRGVEHEREQLVAEVVVRGDVLAAAPRRVAHERGAGALERLADGRQLTADL